MFLAINN